MACISQREFIVLGKESKFKYVLTENKGKDGSVGLVTLNRPSALNSLSYDLLEELAIALREFDDDPSIGAIVITGHDKVFAGSSPFRSHAFNNSAIS